MGLQALRWSAESEEFDLLVGAVTVYHLAGGAFVGAGLGAAVHRSVPAAPGGAGANQSWATATGVGILAHAGYELAIAGPLAVAPYVAYGRSLGGVESELIDYDVMHLGLRIRFR